MTRRAQGPAIVPAAGDAWVLLDECLDRAPRDLHPWLAEPGLLTARVRRACAGETRFRLLRVASAPLAPGLARRMGVADAGCVLREIEFACGDTRWIFAQSVFPESTVERYPWLGELGDRGLGESLARVEDVRREPLEYLELPTSHELARAAPGVSASGRPLWARRAVYRLGGRPILVQEVFLPGLGRCG